MRRRTIIVQKLCDLHKEAYYHTLEKLAMRSGEHEAVTAELKKKKEDEE